LIQLDLAALHVRIYSVEIAVRNLVPVGLEDLQAFGLVLVDDPAPAEPDLFYWPKWAFRFGLVPDSLADLGIHLADLAYPVGLDDLARPILLAALEGLLGPEFLAVLEALIGQAFLAALEALIGQAFPAALEALPGSAFLAALEALLGQAFPAALAALPGPASLAASDVLAEAFVGLAAAWDSPADALDLGILDLASLADRIPFGPEHTVGCRNRAEGNSWVCQAAAYVVAAAYVAAEYPSDCTFDLVASAAAGRASFVANGQEPSVAVVVAVAVVVDLAPVALVAELFVALLRLSHAWPLFLVAAFPLSF